VRATAGATGVAGPSCRRGGGREPSGGCVPSCGCAASGCAASGCAGVLGVGRRWVTARSSDPGPPPAAGGRTDGLGRGIEGGACGALPVADGAACTTDGGAAGTGVEGSGGGGPPREIVAGPPGGCGAGAWLRRLGAGTWVCTPPTSVLLSGDGAAGAAGRSGGRRGGGALGLRGGGALGLRGGGALGCLSGGGRPLRLRFGGGGGPPLGGGAVGGRLPSGGPEGARVGGLALGLSGGRGACDGDGRGADGRAAGGRWLPPSAPPFCESLLSLGLSPLILSSAVAPSAASPVEA